MSRAWFLVMAACTALAAAPAHAAPAPAAGPIELGKQAAEKGDWEGAADAFAEALFADKGSAEARDLLRTAAERVVEARTARIQKERAQLLFRLGLSAVEPPQEPAPEVLQPPQARKSGPPTPEQPIRKRPGRHARRPPVVYAPPVTAAEVEHEPTAADREMARFLYYQGLKAYAENELAEAREAWRKALKLDPNMTRAETALRRVEQSPGK